MIDTSARKMCWSCRRVFPLSAFYRDRSRADGHDAACKTCRALLVGKRQREGGTPTERKVNATRARREAHRRMEERYPEVYLEILNEERTRVGLPHMRSLVRRQRSRG